MFRAYQYNGKNKIDLREDNTPPCTFQKAFELFKTSFHSKMSYPWDERLVRARDAQPGNWQYKLPAKGEPTGKVPPELDPGHPRYVRPEDVASISSMVLGQRIIEKSVSENPYGRRPVFLDKRAMFDGLISKKTSKPSYTNYRAQKAQPKHCYRSKARKSDALMSLKRKSDKSPAPERRSKVNKTGEGRFKSSEFVDDSDSTDDVPRSCVHIPRLRIDV